MRKIILVLVFVLAPGFSFASTANDFIVNPQSTYAVPAGTTNLLILDLTLPGAGLTSIKIDNTGTVQQYDISQLSIYEDGVSPGWDGDESEKLRKSFSPFFDTTLNGTFTKQRIFITVDIASTTYTGKTIKPEIQINSAVFPDVSLKGPTDKKIIGLERMILAGSDTPSAPVSPLAKSGEAISTSTIRWHFTDLSNNEFGFKILDENLNTVASGGANISYLDETGLRPDTEYSGRQIKAFNDRGQNLVSALTVFPDVKTLPLPEIEEVRPPEEVEPQQIKEEEPAPTGTGGPLSPEELRALIQELQQKIINLLAQLIQLLQQQISAAQASLFSAFESFANWLESRF
ncbi:MAG: hypothetical protein HYV47_01005 [Candidatus Nealsonbacteria bacterium]|nr:hypothetical protein [Candidatus Nealsonbacteria bacterium]